MESLLPPVFELGIAFLLRKKVPLLVLVVAVVIAFVPFSDTVANEKLKAVYGTKTTMKAAHYVPDGGFVVVDVAVPQFQTNLLETLYPQRKTSQILVRVHSAAINPVDYKLRLPLFPFVRWFVPNGVARDFSGTVEMVVPGSDACGLKKGDQVFGIAGSGVLQEYIITSCAGKALKPKKLSFDEAAGLPVASGTSYDAVTRNGSIEGKKVLVIGGSGATGSAGVQIAHLLGAHVTTICSSSNSEFVKSLGADEVVDYRSPDWQQQLAKLAPFDLIYDTVSSPEDTNYVPLTFHLLTPNGHYVSINGQPLEFLGAIIYVATGHHVWRQEKYELILPDFDKKLMDNIAGMVVEKGMKVITNTRYTKLTTETVNEAFAQQKGRRAKGKIIFSFLGEE